MQEARGSSPLSSTMISTQRRRGFSVMRSAPFSIFKSGGSQTGSQRSCGLGFLLLAEDGVHGLRALSDHGADQVTVHAGGDRRILVSYQVGNGLDGHAVVAHDRDERVA